MKKHVQNSTYSLPIPTNLEDSLTQIKTQEELNITDPIENIRQVIESDERIARSIEYIRENLDKKITLEGIARNAAYMERTYFSSYFHKKTGLTFQEFLSKFRIYNAVEIMRTEDITASELAYKVGYQDLRTFGRNFKRSTGINQSKFKQSLIRPKLERLKNIDFENNGYDNLKKNLEEIINYYPRIKRAIEYMEKNFSEDISQEDVANAVHIDSRYLSYYFKKVTGIKLIQEYLNIVRISEAIKIMNQEKNKDGERKKITEIGYSVGYNDLRTFERRFKKYLGKTPSSFYKTILEKKLKPFFPF